MCCPRDNYHPAPSDKHLGHRQVSQAFANYILHSPILHRHSSRYQSSSPQQDTKPLDIYIAHVIHASKVPEIVPYTALYLLASISQSCQCRIPHIKAKSDYALSRPSKFSHLLSRVTTRPPIVSQIAGKSNWDDRHFFIGAFYLAILAYKPVFHEENHKELPFWKMISVSKIEEEEIGDISTAFKHCMSDELENTIRAMLWDKFVINVSEFDCPFAVARQRRLSESSDSESENELNAIGKKRKLSLKGSISSFWKLGEKASSGSTAVDSKPEGSVDCGPHSISDESWYSDW
ncbi:hypothetical protein AGABI1DRAFT_89257 [Agaricus bisporus var. burnettii JB137-S8]|uniref:Uncharacterized protein n=1 Tax=Agaricus bisporus var. burnettii (strain JB137-S8 / ATCC MYA-4627 / FGSC 10392) TaxID=597362 RepID=K5XGN7_AGABU|nr:uncharacterized protein AGABI1DRAFT_89257 [Agaricus bisporus var. burnettii JB137-S8]EKM82442.1 hypothetical protein AGABI1DRAFT_89257 [Agaricus bisporus var. burnettii JB137-S8]